VPYELRLKILQLTSISVEAEILWRQNIDREGKSRIVSTYWSVDNVQYNTTVTIETLHQKKQIGIDREELTFFQPAGSPTVEQAAGNSCQGRVSQHLQESHWIDVNSGVFKASSFFSPTSTS